MMLIDRTDTDRHGRIDQMIEKYRAAKQRQLLERALRLWRKAETHQLLAQLEAPPPRVH